MLLASVGRSSEAMARAAELLALPGPDAGRGPSHPAGGEAPALRQPGHDRRLRRSVRGAVQLRLLRRRAGGTCRAGRRPLTSRPETGAGSVGFGGFALGL